MDIYRLREMSNDYRKSALLGTWAKTARGEYTRSTGEVIRKANHGWTAGEWTFDSLSAAMYNVDAKYRN